MFCWIDRKRYWSTMRGSLHLRNDFAAWLIDFLCKSLKQDWKTSKYTAKVILKLSWLKRIFVISSSTLSLVAILSLNFKIINLITSINPGIFIIGFFTTHRETFLLTYVWSVWEKYLFFSQIKFVNLEWTMHIGWGRSLPSRRPWVGDSFFF